MLPELVTGLESRRAPEVSVLEIVPVLTRVPAPDVELESSTPFTRSSVPLLSNVTPLARIRFPPTCITEPWLVMLVFTDIVLPPRLIRRWREAGTVRAPGPFRETDPRPPREK